MDGDPVSWDGEVDFEYRIAWDARMGARQIPFKQRNKRSKKQMRGYGDIIRSTICAVHFVEAIKVDEEVLDLKAEMDNVGIRCAYIDCEPLALNSIETCDAVAVAIGASHAPYGEEHWIRLLDDMISLSTSLSGLVIVMDHADKLFEADRLKVFDLIESFLIQLHHWLGKKKPCHLCFQMSPHPLIEKAFKSPV